MRWPCAMSNPNFIGAAACVAGQAAFGVNDALIKLAMQVELV